MVRLTLGYVAIDEELQILQSQRSGHPLDRLGPVAEPNAIVDVQSAVEQVRIEESVLRYLLSLVTATRNHPSIKLGVSTRGSLQFSRMVRAMALVRGRDYVLPDDVKRLAEPVLAHRLVLDSRAKHAGTDKAALIAELAGKVPVPR